MTLFDSAAQLIAEKSGLTGPQARGSLRLVLKEAGFDAEEVTSKDLAVIVEKLLPKRLQAQGLDAGQAEALCRTLIDDLRTKAAASPSASSSTMFDRLDVARKGAA
jgi:hypothetical protein